MTVTTVNVLKSLRQWKGFRPYNSFLLPVVADGGYPANVDPDHFRFVAPFESDQRNWIRSQCVNIGDAKDRSKYGLTTSFTSGQYWKKAVVEIFENLFHQYMQHPEAKSLGPNGESCKANTCGLLGRSHIIAGRHRRIGKESDRRWEEGDDLESLLYEAAEYEQPGDQANEKGLARPSEWLVRKVRKIGKGKLIDFGLGRRILDKIDGRERVKNTTLQTYEQRIRQFLRRNAIL